LLDGLFEHPALLLLVSPVVPDMQTKHTQARPKNISLSRQGCLVAATSLIVGNP
jgi:hypothetical protein